MWLKLTDFWTNDATYVNMTTIAQFYETTHNDRGYTKFFPIGWDGDDNKTIDVAERAQHVHDRMTGLMIMLSPGATKDDIEDVVRVLTQSGAVTAPGV